MKAACRTVGSPGLELRKPGFGSMLSHFLAALAKSLAVSELRCPSLMGWGVSFRLPSSESWVCTDDWRIPSLTFTQVWHLQKNHTHQHILSNQTHPFDAVVWIDRHFFIHFTVAAGCLGCFQPGGTRSPAVPWCTQDLSCGAHVRETYWAQPGWAGTWLCRNCPADAPSSHQLGSQPFRVWSFWGRGGVCSGLNLHFPGDGGGWAPLPTQSSSVSIKGDMPLQSSVHFPELFISSPVQQATFRSPNGVFWWEVLNMVQFISFSLYWI